MAATVVINPRIPNQDLLIKGLLAHNLQDHVWIQTSGSSSQKWAALSKNALRTSARSVNCHLDATSSDTWLLALPRFHVGGLSLEIRASLTGSKVLTLPEWNPKSFHHLANFCTLSALVPTQLYDLVRLELIAPSSLRAVIIGGAALSDHLHKQALALGWPILRSYGMTEACSQIATETYVGAGTLSVLPHCEIQIRSCRIAICSEALLTMYGSGVDPKEAGWLLTNDVGALEGKTLNIYGRGADFVKILGEGVSLLEVQNDLDAIAPDCVVHAVDDERQGARLIAYTEKEGRQPLIDAYNRKVLPFARISNLIKIEKIPRTETGKVIRSRLL